jgi:poly(A) polymerase
VKKFVRTVAMSRGLSEATATAAGGKIFTFGSYRLGVHGPGSDIDTLCVVPKHVSRDDFFEVFEPMLIEMDGVSEVSVRPNLSFRFRFDLARRASQTHMFQLSKRRFPEYRWIY